MILGTWNLQGVAAPSSAKGLAQVADILTQTADVWFLTEVQEPLRIPGMGITHSPAEKNVTHAGRWSAIATHWHIEPVATSNDPISCLFCMTHLTDPMSGNRVLAVASVTPWRGAANHWRTYLDRQLGHADLCDIVYGHVAVQIEQKLRRGGRLVWGDDFNQGLNGRDYVGALQNRATLIRMLARMGLQVPTMNLAALIEEHPAIDHIALPSDWKLVSEPLRGCAERNGSPLSDHAPYVVEGEEP
jgi:hypothetical protein